MPKQNETRMLDRIRTSGNIQQASDDIRFEYLGV